MATLTDLSMFIFHPFGGNQQQSRKAPVPEQRKPRKTLQSVSNTESTTSTSSISERRDSLSLKIQRVQVHISRTHASRFSTPNIVHFSTLCDVGWSSFKFDLRRLQEILAFPRAWYRRNLARRLFLGEDSLVPAAPPMESASSSPITPRHPMHQARSMELKPQLSSSTNPSTPSLNQSQLWQTLVLFGFTWSELEVNMNMSNVMGTTELHLKNLQGQGRLSMQSSGKKNMYIAGGFESLGLDARNGIVGGLLATNNLKGYLHIKREPHKTPEHRAELRLGSLESRIVYIGTATLMSRITNICLSAKDEWGTERHGSARPSFVMLYSSLRWDQAHMMITRSTTPDLIKMATKLTEFFASQLKSGRRMLTKTTMTPEEPSLAEELSQASAPTTSPLPARHHRHWPPVYRQAMVLQGMPWNEPVSSFLPESRNLSVGGTLELSGNQVVLACFHGLNFKARTWALFTLHHSRLHFAAEAQEANDKGYSELHIIQDLNFALQRQGPRVAQHGSDMATICRIARARYTPSQQASIEEWFEFALASQGQENSAARRGPKGQYEDQESENIFSFPVMEMRLQTKHRQCWETPNERYPKAPVICSFITEFEDHIFISMNAESLIFLRDLIKSYLQEKERSLSSRSSMMSPSQQLQMISPAPESPPAVPQEDWRDYTCASWRLEPTIRLKSYFGQPVEPVGVDYVLLKLGLKHPNNTIPKWIQRGAMDTIDKALAVLLEKLLRTYN